MRVIRAALALAAVLLAATAAPAAAAPQTCDPFTDPRFSGDVPTAQEVIGINLGDRDVTTAESDAYVRAVDAASARVVSDSLDQRSVQGRELVYAIAGAPQNVRSKGLAKIRSAAAELMDPSTSEREAARIARKDPAILWIASNVHGGEESGTDASLRVLYELADRNDCAAERIRDEAIVVILPIQNPDGRELDTRRNAYGFDMNRDWFARTQPETDAKIELLRRYPGVLFIDAHEMGNRAGYFFPPNADPIYHEIADSAVKWINDVYGSAMQDEFDERGIPYFNYNVYDLFYAGYGDTVPANGFGAAGMTFEKTSSHPTPQRVFEQYLTQWISLSQAASNKEQILTEWHDSWVEAKRQGEAGQLEPNFTVEPGNEVVQQVPDMRVRHYFLRPEAGKVREPYSLVRRLQRMDVEVKVLTRSIDVPDYRPYGRAARSQRLPAGTIWVPMAQRQKHWVQSMLNETTYTPVGYAYDIVGWSQPLLYNIDGGFSGERLSPRAVTVPRLPEVARPATPDDVEIALWSMSPQFTRGIESSGWLRWLLDDWGVRYREVTAADIAAGGLEGADVLLVPDGWALQDPDFPEDPYGYADLGPEGRQALTDWVRDGGRYVGWLDGGVLASAVGLSSATYEDGGDAGVSTPGSLFRARVDTDSPLAQGVGPFAWTLDDVRYLMKADPSRTPLRYPEAGSEDFFVSGQADGEEAMGDTAAAVDERFGQGRVVAFNFDPNYRGFTDGTQRMLRNAMFGPDPAVAGVARVGAGERAEARASTQTLTVAHSPLRLVVRARGEDAARRALERYGARYRVQRSPGRVGFVIANPGDHVGDEHPYGRELAATLKRADVPVVLYRVP
jgi:hypothetical protein